MLFIILCGILFLASLLLTFLWTGSKRQLQSLKDQYARLQTESSKQLNLLSIESKSLLSEKIELNGQLIRQQTQNQHLKQQVEDQEHRMKDLLAENRLRFEELSNRILEEKSEKFAKQNQHNLDLLLRPFQEKIKDFEKKIQDTYQREANERFSLKKELEKTFDLNKALSEQANNLTKALKADTKKQGNWGEFILEKILEAAGLQEGIHYKKQVSFVDHQGKTLRPDMVVYLPEGKSLIIDSKVSLTAYERHFNATQELDRKAALKDHIKSVKKHIDELTTKNYEQLINQSPDFVLLFIPIEPAYGLALMESPDLYDYAFRKKIILVSVSSLMATLRIINSIWRLEKQNKNANDIVLEGNKLYDKLVGFVEDIETLGKRLSGAQTAYDTAMNKLKEGRGNLIGRAEKLKNLGLNPSKQLPDGYQNTAS